MLQARRPGRRRIVSQGCDPLIKTPPFSKGVKKEQIATNRPFYSIALAAEYDEEISRKWKELRKQDNEPLLKELLEEVRSANTRSITRQKIAECSWTARKILSNLPESEQRSQLDQIAQALAK